MAGRTTGRPFAVVAPTNQMHKLDFFPGEHTDIMVLVNFGQSAFKYAPANSYRAPNPCFVGPLVNASFHAFYEDSKELFSMGRIDSQWLNRSTTRGTEAANIQALQTGRWILMRSLMIGLSLFWILVEDPQTVL